MKKKQFSIRENFIVPVKFFKNVKMCQKIWRKMDFNFFYEHSSFAGASGACPAPGGAFAPVKFLDPAPGGAFAPAKFFDPARGGARPRRGEAPPGAGPCRGLPRTPEFLAN